METHRFPGARVSERPGKAFRRRSFSSVTANEVIGNPTNASAEKGKRMVDVLAEKLTARITGAATWAELPDIRLDETGGVSRKA
jgi:creatinine amidohydrolase/Fe(II)-dependent formamide hydrolase-like protein